MYIGGILLNMGDQTPHKETAGDGCVHIRGDIDGLFTGIIADKAASPSRVGGGPELILTPLIFY